MRAKSLWRPAVFVVCFALFFSGVSTGAWAGDDSAYQERRAATFDWWSPSYLIDYGLVAGGIAGYVIGEELSPRSEALIGPSYDPDDPRDVFESARVDSPHLEERTGETVPTVWIHRMVAGGAFFVAGLEGLEWARGGGSMHEFHDAFVGYAETVAVTATITSMTKPFVGRLRPDFGERALRYHCTKEPEEYGDYCDGYRDRPLGDDRREARELIDDGQRSFISGHSSHSFNILGYTSLLIGGRYVWGDDATGTSQAVGIATQMAMMGTAFFITGSRVADGRHHLSDTIAGSVVGLALANMSYWRRFSRDGSLRGRSSTDSTTTELSVQPITPGPTISVTVAF